MKCKIMTAARPAMGMLSAAHRSQQQPRAAERRTLQYKQYCTPEILIGWNSHVIFIETYGWEHELMGKMLDRIASHCKVNMILYSRCFTAN